MDGSLCATGSPAVSLDDDCFLRAFFLPAFDFKAQPTSCEPVKLNSLSRGSVVNSAAPSRVLIVDVGYAFTSAGVYELPAEGVPTRLSLAHDSVGARDLDRTLWEHCAAELQAKHGTRVAPRTKPARRLMEEVVKCKKILSTIASCSLELECFGEEERDIRLGLTRAQFEEMAETHVERVAHAALEEAGKQKALDDADEASDGDAEEEDEQNNDDLDKRNKQNQSKGKRYSCGVHR